MKGNEKVLETLNHLLADELTARIIFLEGRPIVSELNPMHIMGDVLSQLQSDHTAEEGAVAGYNAGIRLCNEQGDAGSRELMIDILEDEEEHIDWIEAQLDQVAQMGIQNYLLAQVE